MGCDFYYKYCSEYIPTHAVSNGQDVSLSAKGLHRETLPESKSSKELHEHILMCANGGEVRMVCSNDGCVSKDSCEYYTHAVSKVGVIQDSDSKELHEPLSKVKWTAEEILDSLGDVPLDLWKNERTEEQQARCDKEFIDADAVRKYFTWEDHHRDEATFSERRIIERKRLGLSEREGK